MCLNGSFFYFCSRPCLLGSGTPQTEVITTEMLKQILRLCCSVLFESAHLFHQWIVIFRNRHAAKVKYLSTRYTNDFQLYFRDSGTYTTVIGSLANWRRGSKFKCVYIN